jgi:hypothetical protein
MLQYARATLPPIQTSSKIPNLNILKSYEKMATFTLLKHWTWNSINTYILWRTDPLLGNDSLNTFPWEPTRTTIRSLLLGNGSVNTSKIIQENRRQRFLWGPPRGYITESSKGAVSCQKLRVQLKKHSFEEVGENWVDFWSWQSKVTEKK